MDGVPTKLEVSRMPHPILNPCQLSFHHQIYSQIGSKDAGQLVQVPKVCSGSHFQAKVYLRLSCLPLPMRHDSEALCCGGKQQQTMTIKM